MVAVLYVLCIALANVLTASFSPLVIGPLSIPYGTFLVGLTFLLRDYVQIRFGRTGAYYSILAALVTSAVVSKSFGDTLWITAASAITFLLSESVDTEVFTRFRGTLKQRVILSGVVGGTADSALFVVVGLSPVGAGLIGWEAVPLAIVGQLLIKLPIQAIILAKVNRVKAA